MRYGRAGNSRGGGGAPDASGEKNALGFRTIERLSFGCFA